MTLLFSFTLERMGTEDSEVNYPNLHEKEKNGEDETIEMNNFLNPESATAEPTSGEPKNDREVWSNKFEYYSALIGHSLTTSYLMIYSFGFPSVGKFVIIHKVFVY